MSPAIKGPFRLNRQSVDALPWKPGVFALGDEHQRILAVYRSPRDLNEDVGKRLARGEIPYTYLWYADTWSRRRASRLAERLTNLYLRDQSSHGTEPKEIQHEAATRLSVDSDARPPAAGGGGGAGR